MIVDTKEFKKKDAFDQKITMLGIKSMTELNVFTSLFGSVSATPAFIDILGSTAADAKKFLSGDLPIAKLLKNNIKMLELLPADASRMTR